MNVRFSVRYKGVHDEALAALMAHYGSVDPSVVTRSALALTLAAIPDEVVVASDLGYYRLVIVDRRASSLDVFVEESAHWDLLPQSEQAWSRLKEAMKPHKPSLQQTTLAGDHSSTDILVGRAGFFQNLRRIEAGIAILILVLLAGYVALASATFAQNSWPTMLGGSIPPIATLILIGGATWRRGRGGKIFWESSRGN